GGHVQLPLAPLPHKSDGHMEIALLRATLRVVVPCPKVTVPVRIDRRQLGCLSRSGVNSNGIQVGARSPEEGENLFRLFWLGARELVIIFAPQPAVSAVSEQSRI